MSLAGNTSDGSYADASDTRIAQDARNMRKSATTMWKSGVGLMMLAICLAFVTQAGSEQTPTNNTPPDLETIRWMAGTWRAIDGEETTDECWLPPHANSMVGTCRIATPDKVVVYEFMLIEQEKNGDVTMSMRHYRWNMEDRDKDPIRWKLTKADERIALFEAPGSERIAKMGYERVDANKMRVTLTPKPDPRAKMRQIIFDLNRVDHSKGG